MDKDKIPELSDVQIMLILKNALEFNAAVVQYASFIYGQDLRPQAQRRAVKELRQMAKDYSSRIDKVLGETKDEK